MSEKSLTSGHINAPIFSDFHTLPDFSEGDEEEEYTEEEFEIGKEESAVIKKQKGVYQDDTDSFKCLAEIYVSKSSLLYDVTYAFPPLEDPGLDDAINYADPPEVIDDAGVNIYLKLCKQYKICPYKRIMSSLSSRVLNLKYYGLNEKQVAALMAALRHNKFVSRIILQENCLSPVSVEYLSDMISENHRIRILEMKECRIQSEGADILNDAILQTRSLTKLDLSYNSLDDDGLSNLRDGLTDNETIRILNLRNNNLGEESAPAFKLILANNNFLEELDLSWNNFYSGPGNKILFLGLRKNHSIKKLNISWNAIDTKEATRPIARYLRVGKTLIDFDISGNRITGDSFNVLRNGLRKCSTLTHLKLGNNLLKTDEALSVGKLIKDLPAIKEIRMDNTFVDKAFLPILAVAEDLDVNIVFEGILGNYTIEPVNLIYLMFKRAKFLGMKKKKVKRRKDFGKFVLSLPDEQLPIPDFKRALKKFKIKLDKTLLEQFIDKFPAPQKKVNCVKMKNALLMYYPEYMKEPEKPKMVTEVMDTSPAPTMLEEYYNVVGYADDEMDYDEAARLCKQTEKGQLKFSSKEEVRKLEQEEVKEDIVPDEEEAHNEA